MEHINYRIGNLEVRPTHDHESLEIIQWGESICWNIVSFIPSRDTNKWSAVFVEDRPLDKRVNWQHLRHLIKACYEFLREEETSWDS